MLRFHERGAPRLGLGKIAREFASKLIEALLVMIHIVWEFVVRPQEVDRFERLYGANGDWARLFARYPGYRGTTLLRDPVRPIRYVTIDRWSSTAAYAEMRADSANLYAQLDRQCSTMTESEREIGVFAQIDPLHADSLDGCSPQIKDCSAS